MKLKLATWNINCRSGRGDIPDLVTEELGKKNLDVICLTEFVKTENYAEFIEALGALGYKVFADPRMTTTPVNEILIAIKEECAQETNISVVCENDNDEHPNFLHVVTKLNGENFHIIGTRIKIGGEDLYEDFQNRRTQLQSLMSELGNIEPDDGRVIVMGDFNNGWYSGNDDGNSYLNKPRQHYSYPLLVEEMKAINYQVYTPKEGYSWGNGFKLDHAISNLDNIQNVEYCWDFKENPSYKERAVGYPDHAMLLVTLA